MCRRQKCNGNCLTDQSDKHFHLFLHVNQKSISFFTSSQIAGCRMYFITWVYVLFHGFDVMPAYRSTFNPQFILYERITHPHYFGRKILQCFFLIVLPHIEVGRSLLVSHSHQIPLELPARFDGGADKRGELRKVLMR